MNYSIGSILNKHVKKIYSNDEAFASIDRTGSISVWGNIETGGKPYSRRGLLEPSLVEDFKGGIFTANMDSSTFLINSIETNSFNWNDGTYTNLIIEKDEQIIDHLTADITIASGTISNIVLNKGENYIYQWVVGETISVKNLIQTSLVLQYVTLFPSL